ncbi:MAG: chemotaxis-specific protein-glutamate methyltransferase CheB [Erythrobacter sp.]
MRPRDGRRIRVMIVDDSLTVRTIFKRMVDGDPDMMVCGTASSGERAIAQLHHDRPDVLLLDLEMPGMGGLAALPHILERAPDAQVLVVSSLTQDGAESTVAALSTGAADTMLKPRPGKFDDSYRVQLLDKIRAIGTVEQDKPATGSDHAPSTETGADESIQDGHWKAAGFIAERPEIIAIGASTGGIHAINILLKSLKPDFRVPIVITQHLPPSFIPVFARQIEMASGRPTQIADEGIPIERDRVYIAPGHGHMMVRRSGERLMTATSSRPSRSGCTPSVDPMLASIADTCGSRALAIVLSGMGRDGLEGASKLHEAGARIWVQDAETSAVWGMPGAVSNAGLTSFVGSPEALANALNTRIAKQARREQLLRDTTASAPTPSSASVSVDRV